MAKASPIADQKPNNQEEAALKLSKGLLTLLKDMERAICPGGELSMANYVQQIKDDLKATRFIKSKHGEIQETPDDRLQEGARKRWEGLIDRAFNYGIGLPVQRSESVTKNVDVSSEDQLREKMEQSKHYRAALRKELDRMDSEGSKPVIEAKPD